MSRPLPVVTATDGPFWEAAREGELRMQRCAECGRIRWPPSGVCPDCWSERGEWIELDGRGVVNTWVVYHRSFLDAFEAPYNVAEIELLEGPRYLAPVVDCGNDDLHRGMAVEVAFETVDGFALPVFRPRDPDDRRKD